MGGVVPLALAASETKVVVSVTPGPNHIEPAVIVSCGALSARLSSDSMPVDDKLMLVLHMSDADREKLRRAALARVEERYSWGAVTSAYESLLSRIASKS